MICKVFLDFLPILICHRFATFGKHLLTLSCHFPFWRLSHKRQAGHPSDRWSTGLKLHQWCYRQWSRGTYVHSFYCCGISAQLGERQVCSQLIHGGFCENHLRDLSEISSRKRGVGDFKFGFGNVVTHPCNGSEICYPSPWAWPKISWPSPSCINDRI